MLRMLLNKKRGCLVILTSSFLKVNWTFAPLKIEEMKL